MDFIDATHCQQIIDVHFKHYAGEDELEAKTEHGFTDFKVTPFGEKNGHLGEYFLLEILLTKGKQLRLFVKKILSKPNRPEYVKFLTHKEFNFYKWLLDEGLVCSCLPRYYLSTDTFIVLELIQKFKLLPRDNTQKTYLDYAHLKCAVVALAKFHSTVTTNKLTTRNFLEEAMFTPKLYMTSISKGIHQYLSQKNLTKEIRIFEEQIDEIMVTFGNPEKSSGFKVISHGDLWSNNLLFAYNGETPVECKLIDFQMIRFAEPAHDLCTLLIHNAYYENFGELTDLYYQEISETLRQNMPRIDFDTNIKKHARFALITKIIYAAFAAATQLRKDEGLSASLDVVMSVDNYTFLIKNCSRYKEQNNIFNNLTLALSKLGDLRITQDVVHRLIHNVRKKESEILNFFLEQKLLKVTLTTGRVLKFLVKDPNPFYEIISRKEYLQECYIYLKEDLMITEYFEDHKLQNLRQPFGLDDVKQCLKILAEFHANSYLHPVIKNKYQPKNWEHLTDKLHALFHVLKIKVNWNLLHEKLYSTPIFADCVQHSAFNHEFIYFPKSKFDLELISGVNSLKIVLPSEMYRGSACEEVLAFLYSSTTTTFLQYYTQDMLVFYYNCFVNILKVNEMLVPFTLEEFLEKYKLFEGLATIGALLYHQKALVVEKCQVFKMAEEVDEEAIQKNYDCDEVYRGHIDDQIVKFCSIFNDVVENKV